jgi:hypothetical protein
MAQSRTLKLSILADVDNLTKNLKTGSQDVDTFGTKLADFGKKAAAAFAVAAVAAAAFAVKFAKDAIVAGEAAATANARIEQINKSMGLFGDSVNVVSERLIKYAEETARATGIDTNSIKATQAKLLTFKELAATANEVGGQFDRATKAAIDLASAGFGAAETNAVQLGKALNDPIKGLTALARSGVTFTEQEKERIKTLVQSNKIGEAQAEILKAIEMQVGGTAEATANATEKMKVGFQQVSERVGIALLPIVEKFTNFLLDKLFPTFERYILPVVQKLTAAFSEDNGGLGDRINKLANILKSLFLPIWNGLVSAFNSVKGAVQDNLQGFIELGTYITKFLAPIIGTVLGGALNIAGKIASGVITVVGGVVKAINAVIGTAIDGINLLIKAYNAIPFLGNIPTISKPSISAPSIPSASMPSISTKLPTISAATTGGTSASTTGGSGGGGGGVSTAAKSAVSTAAVMAAGSFDVGSFRMAEERGNTYNINVTGALDKEGVARQIVEIINDSGARGTGGVGAFQAV